MVLVAVLVGVFVGVFVGVIVLVGVFEEGISKTYTWIKEQVDSII